MNIVTCQFQPCSKPLPPKSGRGKPAKFCSPSCKIAHHRSLKKLSQPINPFPSIPKNLPELAAKAQSKALPTNIPHHILASMPTQNDANIAAIIARGADSPLPFPDHNAIPLCSLPGPIPLLPPIKEITPTF